MEILIHFLLLIFLVLTSNICPKLLFVQSQGDNESTKIETYIVHVQKPQGTKFLRFRDRVNWYRSFLPNTTLINSGEPRMIYAYRHVISGFSARLTRREVSTMEATDGFVLAYPEKKCTAHTTYTPRFLGLNRRGGLWPKSSYGKGLIIGVIDTGVKPTHPSFSDHNMPPPPERWRGSCYWAGRSTCNNKLIGASAFHSGSNPEPMDTGGHGTHTASTAAGNFVDGAGIHGLATGVAAGMAPWAHIASYKVLFDNQGTDSDILAGIDQAIHDGVDILSMSLGYRIPVPLYENSIAIASFAAISKGLGAVASAGNEGPGYSTVGNDAPWILTVGASTTDRRMSVSVLLGDGTIVTGETAYQPKGPFESRISPLIHPGAVRREDAYCSQEFSAAIDVAGKIVMCETGVVANVDKGAIVRAAGGAGMIIMNKKSEGLTTFANAHVLPTAHVDYDDAVLIIDYVEKTRSPTAALVFEGTQFGAEPAPSVAFFSSRGPSLMNGNILKPDIVAPGVNIVAAWPTDVGPCPSNTSMTFDSLSGTSMAAPHTAGVVALLKKNHPSWSYAAIKSAIMTTATTREREGFPIPDEQLQEASVLAIGAGHISSSADEPGLVYEVEDQVQEYISYLCGSGFTDRQVTAITRRRVRCDSMARKITGEEVNYPSISVELNRLRNKTITRTVTNVGKAVISYIVKVEAPENVDVVVKPSRLEFSRVGEKKNYSVTFSFKYSADATTITRATSEGSLSWVDSQNESVRSPFIVTLI
ncbi:subtilisin-like protease [Typha angustifolia]|uniref:subtilisin-like protease n=1 Tax=Typha angustifolia TaxID=59011 RepID=UPI003C305081